MSRKSIILGVSGLLVVAGGFLLVAQQRGERRLDAAMERFETEIGTLDPVAHTPPELPDEDNAAFWLKQGAEALSSLSGDERVALNELWEKEGDPGPGVEALLERHAVALEHLHRAGELRASSWGVRYDAGTDAPLPEMLPHLWSKKTLAADARAALATGDRQRLLADARALAALRRALENEPLLACQMLAMSIELAQHELVQQALLHETLLHETLSGDESRLSSVPSVDAIFEELAELLDAGDAGRALRASFAVEAARMIQGFDSMVADEGALWHRLRNVPMRMWAPMEYASGVDFYYRLAKATEMPVGEIALYLSSNASSTPGRRTMARTLVPYLVDSVKKSRASAAARRLAGLAIEARLHAVEHGAFPEHLESLAGAGLADPYSGGDLHYTKRPDGSAVVSFPDGQALWQKENPSSPHYHPRFVWHLPSL